MDILHIGSRLSERQLIVDKAGFGYQRLPGLVFIQVVWDKVCLKKRVITIEEKLEVRSQTIY